MNNELVLIQEINKPYLLSDNLEKQIKVRLRIQPSEEIRKMGGDIKNKMIGTDVCIVLDSSGSMGRVVEGETKSTGEKKFSDGRNVNMVTGGTCRSELANYAVQKLVPLLRESDTISLITYSDSPKVIFKGLRNNDKDKIINEIKSSLYWDGNTNMSAAIREARILLSEFSDLRTKKIIFLTDGYPEGDTEENVINESKILADYNISIDCIGIGEKLNFNLMEKIVVATKGRTNIIHDSSDTDKVFASFFKKSQEVIATNAKLKLTFSQQIRVSDHYRGEPENLYLGKVELRGDDRVYEMPLGQLERNQRYDYYFNITVAGQGDYTGTFRIMKAEISYYIPSLGDERKTINQNVQVEFGNNGNLSEMTTGDVENGYTLAEIKRLEVEADKAMEAKEIIRAINKYEEILGKYQENGMSKEIEMFQGIIKDLKENNCVSQAKLNESRNSSSKATNSSELSRKIEDTTSIFGPKLGRLGNRKH